MEAKFSMKIFDVRGEEVKVADISEETLRYLGGVMEDAIEENRKVSSVFYKETDLGDGWQVSFQVDKGFLGNILGE